MASPVSPIVANLYTYTISTLGRIFSPPFIFINPKRGVESDLYSFQTPFLCIGMLYKLDTRTDPRKASYGAFHLSHDH